MKGYVHSIETFATLDGGGIRGMVFLSGCKFRCQYCHNPDTWYTKGTLYEHTEIVTKLAKNKNYYKNGGITISGGEPLLQSEYTLALLKDFKREGLHTAIDTSACVLPANINNILDFTDLIILDLKFYSEELYQRYCSGSMQNVLKLIDIINQKNKKVLLRTVILPAINDNIECLDKYLNIAKTIKNLTCYELLGYHTLGVDKYKKLGLDYKLTCPPLENDKLIELQGYINRNLYEKR